jgi:hypothetical protein
VDWALATGCFFSAERTLGQPERGVLLQRPAPVAQSPASKSEHGVSEVKWGERFALGILFHDAA